MYHTAVLLITSTWRNLTHYAWTNLNDKKKIVLYICVLCVEKVMLNYYQQSVFIDILCFRLCTLGRTKFQLTKRFLWVHDFMRKTGDRQIERDRETEREWECEGEREREGERQWEGRKEGEGKTERTGLLPCVSVTVIATELTNADKCLWV